MTDGTSATAEATTVEEGQGTEDGTPATPYLVTPTSQYKTAEEAAKGFAEKDKALQAAQTELARLRNEQKQAEALTQLSEQIGKMNTSSSTADQQREHEAMLKRMAEEVDQNPGKAIEYLQSSIQGLDADYDRKLKAERDSLKSEVGAELEALKAELARAKLVSDPVYRDNQDAIQEAVAEFGVTEEQAVKIVAKQAEQAGSQSDAPLGTTGTSVSTAQPERAEGLKPEIRAFLEQQAGRALTDDEVTAIQEKRSRG